MENFFDELDLGLDNLNIVIDAFKKQKIFNFVELLKKWNKVYNLTSIRDIKLILSHHIFDSLSILKYLNNSGIIADIGTGAGMPGIPLAIVNPNKKFTLFDSNNKKASFLNNVVSELELSNVIIENIRVEKFYGKKFDILISRAFSQLDDFIKVTNHIINKDGFWIAMKGVYPYDEIDKLPSNIIVKSVDKLVIPRMDKQRHVVILKLGEVI